MAAIVPIASPIGGFVTLQNVSAQATTGQTDVLLVPHWASYCVISDNLTARAGTSPTHTLSIQAIDPVALDDAEFMSLAELGALTAATAQRMAGG